MGMIFPIVGVVDVYLRSPDDRSQNKVNQQPPTKSHKEPPPGPRSGDGVRRGRGPFFGTAVAVVICVGDVVRMRMGAVDLLLLLVLVMHSGMGAGVEMR